MSENIYAQVSNFLETPEGIELFVEFLSENLYKTKSDGLPGEVDIDPSNWQRQIDVRKGIEPIDDEKKWKVADLIWLVLNGNTKESIYKGALELRERFMIDVADSHFNNNKGGTAFEDFINDSRCYK